MTFGEDTEYWIIRHVENRLESVIGIDGYDNQYLGTLLPNSMEPDFGYTTGNYNDVKESMALHVQ